MADEFHEAWRRRSRAWSDPDSTWARLQGWYERARLLFEDPDTRRKVFGAQADLFEAHDIRTTITMVAVTNAIMAGLPGKMGVGVFVSIALELWMVRRIGSFVGISIKSGRDALAYLGMLGVTVLGLFEGFRVLLGLAFSLFAFLPVAMVPAELLVTDLVGVLVWVAFEELKQRDRFRVPLRSLGRVKDVTVELLQHQVGLLRRQFRKERLREVSRNLARYFRGEGITERRILHDDAFVAAAFALLLEDDARAFEGPIGRELKAALVDVVPEFEGLDDSELAGRLSEYDGDRLRGLLSSVKGRLFERLVEEAENSDGDAWIARSHPDRTHPGTDLVFANTETGEELEVSLKATDSRAYVEEALARYPDAPLLVTDEAAELFEDDPRVEPTGMSNEDLEEATRSGLGEAVEAGALSGAKVAGAAFSGVALGTAVGLWPWFAAWKRGKIRRESLERVVRAYLGRSAGRMVIRVCGALAFGPLYGWYVLARCCTRAVRAADASR